MSVVDDVWPYIPRRRRVLEVLSASEASLIVLLGPPNMTYLTGIRDPTGSLLISDSCGDAIVTSILDYHRINAQAPREVDVIAVGREGEESINTDIIPRLYRGTLAKYLRGEIERCGIKEVYADLKAAPGYLRETLEALKREGVEVSDASDALARVRSIKDDYELELISKAIEISESAFSSLVSNLGSELTEALGAAIIYSEIMRRGAWSYAFPTIVAFHENTAYPHHTPTPRKLGPEGPVLIDWGSVYRGYCSDMTRTFWHGSSTPARFKSLVEAVIEAQNAALDTAGPGVAAGQVDRAARAVLEKMGYSRYFIHGLGHGVGIEVHERPYLRPGSKEVLEPGMVVTVEPGVYIPGLYGVRIEDMILITRRGARLLTRLSRVIE
ncbi:MAG: Xaa-Pro peptidase family protein [Desulfurococcales archaeon]|nr:Xaa-Pro peptidase family protein [Desulfurococcales archaeon]